MYSFNCLVVGTCILFSSIAGCENGNEIIVDVSKSNQKIDLTITHTPANITLDNIEDLDTYREEVEFLLESLQEVREKMVILEQDEKENSMAENLMNNTTEEVLE